MTPPLLAVHNLTRRFGARTAVQEVSFEVKAGEALGLPGCFLSPRRRRGELRARVGAVRSSMFPDRRPPVLPSALLLLGWLLGLAPMTAAEGPAAGLTSSAPPPRLRVVIETDAGGDPDDEQSLVRFLLYANEWEVEGIVANRAQARDGENRNPERSGLGIVRRMLAAYGACWTNLVQHDPRYPTRERLEAVTVAGDDSTEEAVNLFLAAVDRPDPRPIWYSDWGTDHGAATNNLRRALDRVLRERGPEGYARFKSRLRLASADAFGPHTGELAPPFPLWVDTFRPELNGRRWYHRFSALTSRAGGFDLVRDAITGHGPLGALYPTNTTHWAKEGDSMSFLYLVPNGLNDPEHPGWGGWAGRYGPNETRPGKPYYWANQSDFWNGSTNRDQVLARWAEALQNDFRARLDWCVAPRNGANHPPVVEVTTLRSRRDQEADSPKRDLERGPPRHLGSYEGGFTAVTLRPGESVSFSGASSSDPDDDNLSFRWEAYREAGTYRGSAGAWATNGPTLAFTAPDVTAMETIHLILSVTDPGTPPLTRYARVVVTVDTMGKPVELGSFFAPPPAFAKDFGSFRSPLEFRDGTRVRLPDDWRRRREEILREWQGVLGPWPPLLDAPRVEILESGARENFTQYRLRVEIARDQWVAGWLLIPAAPARRPAVLVPFYEPETSAGLNASRHRDFALQLSRRGFVTLAIGSPGGDARNPETGSARCQPLSFLAYAAANAHTLLVRRPEVDPARIGIVGHSYGGKWALFAAAFDERFAGCVVSDPGIVFDETRPNVNYWEPWYLGRDDSRQRQPGLVTAENPRTGAYRDLVAGGHDLHEVMALLAPRPFLVSGGAEDPPERWRALNHVVAVNDVLKVTNRVALTNRSAHDPDAESNAVIFEFFERFLGPEEPR